MPLVTSATQKRRSQRSATIARLDARIAILEKKVLSDDLTRSTIDPQNASSGNSPLLSPISTPDSWEDFDEDKSLIAQHFDISDNFVNLSPSMQSTETQTDINNENDTIKDNGSQTDLSLDTDIALAAVSQPCDLVHAAINNALASLSANLADKVASIDANLTTNMHIIDAHTDNMDFSSFLHNIPVLPMGPLQVDLIRAAKQLHQSLDSTQATMVTFLHEVRELHIEALFDECDCGLPMNASLELQGCLEIMETLAPACFPHIMLDNILISKVLELDNLAPSK